VKTSPANYNKEIDGLACDDAFANCLKKLVNDKGNSFEWGKPNSMEKIRIEHEMAVPTEPGIYSAGEYISKHVLNLVNGRMTKWAVTTETLKRMNLDTIIQESAQLRNNYVYEQRAPFFDTLIKLKAILETKVDEGRLWEAATLLEEMLPPLAEVVGFSTAMRIKDFL
jgi:hypothetical protein